MGKPKDILIIDDDAFFAASLSDFLQSKGFRVQRAETGLAGVQVFENEQPSLVLLDQELPDRSGIDICKQILERSPGTKVIFITAYATVKYAVGAMQAGAFNYLSKPFELDELLIAVDMAIRNVELEGRIRLQDYQKAQERQRKKLLGNSEAMKRIREQIALAAHSDANILVTGETGVGKNEVARVIHESQAKRETFLAINCSAIPENLIEAEYFGHEKGVFTGANSRREGIFELADGGTLLLDEIGEIPTHLQSKLLTVLEEKCIRRIGSGRNIPVDVRIIATTNQDLQEAISAGKFRQDLYYRLAVFTIRIPPLREHAEDISEIAHHFAERFCKRPMSIPKHDMDKLMQYLWPGNIRELRNVIERASLLSRGSEMRPAGLLMGDVQVSSRLSSNASSQQQERVAPLAEIEKRHILSVLNTNHGNKSRTAKALGIALSTLKRKLKEIDVAL